jgi:tRNA A-37 threonylcarbamoyl transferase component Bud32
MDHQVATGPPGTSTSHRRRRRPAGQPPPLPRELRGPARLWFLTVILLIAAFVWGRNSHLAGVFQRWIDKKVDAFVPDLSGGGFARAGRSLAGNLGLWTLIATRWGTAIALIMWKRWRHLVVFVGSVAAVTVTVRLFPTAGTLPSTPKHPAYAAASLAVTLMGIAYGLVPAGRQRTRALIVSAVVFALLATFSILTRTYTLSEIAIGFAIGVSIPYLGFRLFAPETVFPVRYQLGRTAHLDIGGSRGEAIDVALREQLGLEVASKEPFGLAGSGGSTPLRIVLTDGRRLFAKLYAQNHLRADRWYKIGRAVMYGALEDERSFNSVRRMVEYEDHMLRYLRDHDVSTAEPYGFAEITPEREYLLVTSFIDDAVEILDAPIDDRVIMSGIELIHSLWEAGVAHRDIKPSNLLVRDGHIYLIDVFFCQVRPSAWRQSIDLANMLMLLALGSEVDRVYRATLRRFTRDDVAEAFAATKGVTVPSQLRSMVMADPRPIAKEFSQLAPDRERILVQRWSARRLLLATALFGGAAASFVTAALSLRAAGFKP